VVRRRLDEELVRRGLAVDEADARAAVREGLVSVGGRRVANDRSLVAPDESVDRADARRPYASRGGEKVDAALARFGIDPSGADALDAGASTGGFTDCLLKRGARRVLAVDVAYGALAWSLRTDPRVIVLERTSVRDLRGESLPFAPDLVVADLSFVSLRTALPALARVAAPRCAFVVLVKPQFESPREEVERGGVVRDPAAWRRAIEGVADAFRALDVTPRAVMASPLRGPAGNVEFLLHASTPGVAGGGRRASPSGGAEGPPADAAEEADTDRAAWERAIGGAIAEAAELAEGR
jgi:23S rRNA (cytidine1920-2'-O)/16S rRNA (cytidine1409-2'-O)-methyltransferase